jgi:hypothetical protein
MVSIAPEAGQDFDLQYQHVAVDLDQLKLVGRKSNHFAHLPYRRRTLKIRLLLKIKIARYKSCFYRLYAWFVVFHHRDSD